MKGYSVMVPIAGHIEVVVEAESEEAAIAAAMDSDDLNLSNIVNWEALDRFTGGNVCYCPHPWEAEAVEVES